MRNVQGIVSISDMTSYFKISQSLETVRFVSSIIRSLWNMTGTSAALLPKCLSYFKATWALHSILRSHDKRSYRILKQGPGRVPGAWLTQLLTVSNTLSRASLFRQPIKGTLRRGRSYETSAKTYKVHHSCSHVGIFPELRLPATDYASYTNKDNTIFATAETSMCRSVAAGRPRLGSCFLHGCWSHLDLWRAPVIDRNT